MDIMFKYCAGLDVHKRMIVACVLLLHRLHFRPSPEGVQRFIKKFATTMEGLAALDAWLTGLGVTHVATPAPTAGAVWNQQGCTGSQCSMCYPATLRSGLSTLET